jgi:hypothetical protein
VKTGKSPASAPGAEPQPVASPPRESFFVEIGSFGPHEVARAVIDELVRFHERVDLLIRELVLAFVVALALKLGNNIVWKMLGRIRVSLVNWCDLRIRVRTRR